MNAVLMEYIAALTFKVNIIKVCILTEKKAIMVLRLGYISMLYSNNKVTEQYLVTSRYKIHSRGLYNTQ